jgi:hypothetical protein
MGLRKNPQALSVMISDRRKHKRYTINRIAKFQTDSGALPRDCMITDISQDGARLFADGIEIPDQFQLLISGEKGDRRECRVVWRLGGEIGVTFVGPGLANPRNAGQ